MNEERPPINGYRLTWQILGTLMFAGFLGAIFFPVFAGNGYSPKTSCLSNLKQTNLAAIMYAGDNNDALPFNFSFDGPDSQIKYTDAIFPYCKNRDILLCPQEQKDIKENKATAGQEGIAGKMDYVHCLSLRGFIPDFSAGKRFLQVTSLKDPAKTPYLRDPIRGYGTAKDNKVVGFLSPHGGGFNTGFVDGHAKYVKSPNINSDL